MRKKTNEEEEEEGRDRPTRLDVEREMRWGEEGRVTTTGMAVRRLMPLMFLSQMCQTAMDPSR